MIVIDFIFRSVVDREYVCITFRLVGYEKIKAFLVLFP